MPFVSFENSRVENALAKVASSIGDRYPGGEGGAGILSICPEILLSVLVVHATSREKRNGIYISSSSPRGAAAISHLSAVENSPRLPDLQPVTRITGNTTVYKHGYVSFMSFA